MPTKGRPAPSPRLLWPWQAQTLAHDPVAVTAPAHPSRSTRLSSGSVSKSFLLKYRR